MQSQYTFEIRWKSIWQIKRNKFVGIKKISYCSKCYGNCTWDGRNDPIWWNGPLSTLGSYKSYLRRISDHVNFFNPEVVLYARENILKLNAFTYSQFKSPWFKNFIQYTWKKSGLWSKNVSSIDEECQVWCVWCSSVILFWWVQITCFSLSRM